MSKKDKINFPIEFFIGMMSGMFLLAIFFTFITYPIHLNQTTANEICYNITQIKEVEARSLDGQLICEVPILETKPAQQSNIILKNVGVKEE